MKTSCNRCGYCCTLKVLLTAKEIEQIKSQGFTACFENDLNGIILKRQENGDCYFLKRTDDQTACRIYSIRPKPCRAYPPYSQNQSCREFNPAVRAYEYRKKELERNKI